MKLPLFWMIGFIMSLVGYTSNVLATPYVTVDKNYSKFRPGPSGVGGVTDYDYAGRWEWKEQTGDVSICNIPTGCFLKLTDYPQRLGPRIKGYGMLNIGFGSTATQAQAKWASFYGTSGSWSVQTTMGFTPITTCFGMVIMSGPQLEFIPGSSCASPPPVNLSCTTSGKVTIDYGTLDGSKLNGTTASTTLSITCNQAATATIKLNDSVIDLGRKGDLTAAISIGGKDLASGSDVAVKSGTVTTTITSTLKAKGTPAAGAFEGSGVLIIGYQ
ncbi:hypothetical protein [Serratia proteamaculans]|uniref:MrpH family fimbial adhesin n=1 Tax=Serratia proteamaculans TaxID=28151 RepID=UPI0039AF7B60